MSLDRIILDLTRHDKESSIGEYARRRGFSRYLLSPLTPFQPHKGETVFTLGADGRVSLPGGEPVESFEVRSPGDLDRVAERLRAGATALVSFRGESVIPLENLLAMRQGKGTLLVTSQGPGSVPALLGALEHGSDAVVVPVRGTETIDELERFLESPQMDLLWKEVRVLRTGPGGTGDRVIVDTTSMLGEAEGILVGSSGGFLLHVVSEVKGSRYTRPRPFRVNAGALHSYTLLSGGETRYLSELEPGDQVVAAAPGNRPRTVRVGRLKVERRPLTLIEVEHDGNHYTLFAQEAETVRLSGHSGPVPVTEVRAGDTLWGVSLPKARHFGKVVDETILER